MLMKPEGEVMNGGYDVRGYAEVGERVFLQEKSLG